MNSLFSIIFYAFFYLEVDPEVEGKDKNAVCNTCALGLVLLCTVEKKDERMKWKVLSNNLLNE